MNNRCPNCGVAGNNFGCMNHVIYWPAQSLPDMVPFLMPDNSSLFIEIGRLNVLLKEKDNEIEQLKTILSNLRELGVIDQWNRPLPLEDHHKDCDHGKNGFSLCTCDELKIASQETTHGKQGQELQELLKECQKVREELSNKSGKKSPPLTPPEYYWNQFQCSKCNNTGLIAYGPNVRGMKICDCRT